MTTLPKEQDAVLTAVVLKGQVETFRVKVEEADKATAEAIAQAAIGRDAAIARARTVFNNEQKLAADTYANAVSEAQKEPMAARSRLEEAESALTAHLEKMQKEMGIHMGWLNPAPRGGRVNL